MLLITILVMFVSFSTEIALHIFYPHGGPGILLQSASSYPHYFWNSLLWLKGSSKAQQTTQCILPVFTSCLKKGFSFLSSSDKSSPSNHSFMPVCSAHAFTVASAVARTLFCSKNQDLKRIILQRVQNIQVREFLGSFIQAEGKSFCTKISRPPIFVHCCTKFQSELLFVMV